MGSGASPRSAGTFGLSWLHCEGLFRRFCSHRDTLYREGFNMARARMQGSKVGRHLCILVTSRVSSFRRINDTPALNGSLLDRTA